MKEIEIELEVENFDEIKNKLSGWKGPRYHTVYYFNKEKLQNGEIIRLRDRLTENKEEKKDIGYKGKIKDVDGIQIRDEFTVSIDDSETALKMMRGFFGEPIYLQKAVTYYIHKEDVRIRITDTALKYIEFEGPEEKVRKVFEELNLKGTVLRESAIIEILKRKGLI